METYAKKNFIIGLIKRKVLTFIKNLQFIFKPRFWSMNYSYCSEHDKNVRRAIFYFEASLGKVNSMNSKIYYILFKNKSNEQEFSVWIQNYPYAYGRESDNNSFHIEIVRPSRLTILKLRELEKDLRSGKIKQKKILRKTTIYI